jgi:hypothetical protein
MGIVMRIIQQFEFIFHFENSFVFFKIIKK